MKRVGEWTWYRSLSGQEAAKALLNPCFISAGLAVKPAMISELYIKILHESYREHNRIKPLGLNSANLIQHQKGGNKFWRKNIRGQIINASLQMKYHNLCLNNNNNKKTPASKCGSSID